MTQVLIGDSSQIIDAILAIWHLCDAFLRLFLTVYPPQAVRQIILAVDRLITGGDVTEVAGLLHAVWWREGLEGKQAVVAVNLRRYIC